MTSRFQYALNSAQAPNQMPLADLARNFLAAVEQTEAEGTSAHEDPAVIVLGSFIAFHTHADVNTAGGYHQLLRLCADRLYNEPVQQ